MSKYTQTEDDDGTIHYWNRAGREVDVNGRWIKGTSGNPAGKPKGAKNKLTTVREAAERGEGLSPGEMLMEIAHRNFAQNTSGGDALAMKAIIEANKHIEATGDNAVAAPERLKQMSDEEITEELKILFSRGKNDK